MLRLFSLFLLALVFAPVGVAAFAAPASTTTTPAPARWSTLSDTVFEHITTKEGLPNPVVTALAEDAHGFLWVGTQGGLARWDGYRFRVYQPDPKDSASLPDNWIRVLHTDKKGRLWVGTSSGGLARYDPLLDQFIRFPVGPQGVGDATVHAIVDDGSGGIWVGTPKGLDHFLADGSVTHRTQVSNDPRCRLCQSVNSLLLDTNGKMWIGTSGGLSVMERNGGESIAVPLPVTGKFQPRIATNGLMQGKNGVIWIGTFNEGAWYIDPNGRTPKPLQVVADEAKLRNETISAIVETRSGEMWFGTYGKGIVIVDANLHQRRLNHDVGVPTSFASAVIYSMHIDKAGLLWVSTQNGLERTDPNRHAILSLFGGTSQTDSIASPMATSVTPMPDGSVWLGLQRDGIQIIDSSATKVTSLRPDPVHPDASLPNEMVNAISTPIEGAIYIGSTRGLFRLDVQSQKIEQVRWPKRNPDYPILAIVPDGRRLWLGGADGLWLLDLTDASEVQATRPPGVEKVSGIIEILTLDDGGKLWMGTRSNGLFRYDPVIQDLRQFVPDSNNPAGLTHRFISTLLFDSRGRLWAGTQGGGINLLTVPGAEGPARFHRIGTGQGLPNDMVNSLLEDDKGNIWVTTDGGLAIIDPTTLAVRSIKQAEGAHISAYFAHAGAITPQGELLFGGDRGLTVVRPALYRDWIYRPPVVVSDVMSGGKHVPPLRFNTVAASGNEPFPISPEANSFSVEFSALDYSAPERNRYAYRLDGYDKDWIEVDPTRRVAAYTNLPPDDYRLRLRGSNRNGVWTEQELVMPIRVLPAWYQTWWIRMIEMLVAVAAIYALVQGRTRYLRQRQRDLENQVHRRTIELQENKIELLDKNEALARLNQQQEIQKNELTVQKNELTDHKNELLDKNEELARLNALQETQQSELTRFLAVASHDLRQPMHALNLYLGALSHYDMAESARPVLGNVRQCAEIMDSMFLALLDLSRLDAHVVEPLIEAFPIASLLTSIEVEFAPQAAAKGLQLRVVPCSLWVESDVALVSQILSNLVANAVRYTESGTILVGCKRRGMLLRLAVFDTGIGISPDQQKSVFEEFCQVGNAGRDRTKGLGLGLAIVRRLARLLAAPITLVSNLGRGSMFAVDLPIIEAPRVLQDPSESDPADTATRSTQDQLAGKLIIVVDDETSILDAMRALLEQWGCIVVTAESAEAAIAKLSDSVHAPDALICDYQLRLNETGFEVIDVLQEEFNCDIPAMIITGTITPQRIQEMALTGMPVLHKPVSAETLRKVLERLVGRR